MQVLVTRPAEQAAETAAALAVLRHEAIISPVIEIVATDASWPAGTIDRLIATSARAFEALHIEPDFPTPETRRLIPLLLVGEKTSAAARVAGFAGAATIASDVRHLAPLLHAHLRPAMRALYLAGRERKLEVEAICADQGVPLVVVETYGAEPAAQLTDMARQALDEGSIGAVLHYSRRSAAIFLELLEADGFDPAALTHVAISEEAAEPLRALDLPRVRVTARPDENSMLALLDAEDRV